MIRTAISILCLLFWATPVLAQVEIELWHSYRPDKGEEKALLSTVDDFNIRHRDIQIKVVRVPSDAYLDKITAAIPLGNGPDVFVVAHDRIGGWADSALIAPIDEFLAPGLLDRFFQKTVDPLTYRRLVYGLPTSYKTTVLFYNKDLLPRPPANTQELLSIAKRIQEAQKAQGQPGYGLVYDYNLLYFHACWLFGFKGALFNARGELVLDSPQNMESLRLAAQLRHELMPADISSIKVTSLFNNGQSAMAINGPWFRSEIDPAIRYGVALLPEINQSGSRARPFLSAEAFLLSAKSRNPKAAFRVMDELTQDAAARVRLHTGLQPVANIAVYRDADVKSDPVVSVFREELEYAVPMSNSPQMRLVWEPMNKAISLVTADPPKATPEEALAEAQNRVSTLLADFQQGATLKESDDSAAALARSLWWGIGGGITCSLILMLIFRKRLKRMIQEALRQKSAYAYITPAMLAMLLLVFVPFMVGLGLSLFHYYQGAYYFVGIKNFSDILSSHGYPVTDPMSFYYKLFITILWTATNVFLHLCIGLGLALLLKNPRLRFKGLYRVLLIIPWAIPNYITAIVWRGMFDADFGVINHMLGLEGFSWWQSTWSAFLANLICNCWLGFPFMMVVSLGALQSIPKELYEAADVDGASRWHQFRHITLPLLKPALFPAIILGVIWTFNMFNVIYLVSRGEPNGSTNILVVEAFKWAFERGDQYGYAAAYSALIFVILLAYTLLTNRITKATEGAFD